MCHKKINAKFGISTQMLSKKSHVIFLFNTKSVFLFTCVITNNNAENKA